MLQNVNSLLFHAMIPIYATPRVVTQPLVFVTAWQWFAMTTIFAQLVSSSIHALYFDVGGLGLFIRWFGLIPISYLMFTNLSADCSDYFLRLLNIAFSKFATGWYT